MRQGLEADDAIDINSIRNVWLGMHGNRYVSIRGVIKFLQRVPNDEGLNVYVAELHDDSGYVRISWLNHYVSPSPYKKYKVTGRCRSIRGVYPRLANCNIELLDNTNIALPRDDHAVHGRAGVGVARAKVEATPPTNSQYAYTTGSGWSENSSGSSVESNSPWGRLRLKVLGRDGRKCVKCGSGQNLTVDHIKQLSIGGDNSLSNLQTLCADCHEEKDHIKIFDIMFDGRPTYGFDTRVSEKIKRINDSIKSHGFLEVIYKSRDGEVTTRRIRPIKIYKGTYFNEELVGRRCVYVQAFCELRGDNRTFRVSRMSIA